MAAPNKGPHGPFHMDQRMGIIALLLSTTGMGLAGCLTRGATRVDFFGTEYVAGESIGAWMTLGRMVCGLLTFIVLVCVTRRAGVLRRTQVSPSIILGGLCIGIALSLYMVSALLTTLADAVFLIYTGPLFCTLLSRLIRKERISPSQWACLALVFCGMLFTAGIVSVEGGSVSFGFDVSAQEAGYPQKGLGDALGLCSGVFYGLSLFFNGYRKDCDSVVRGVWNFAAASAGSIIVALGMSMVWPLGEVQMSAANWGFAWSLWLICGPFALGLLLVAGRNLPAVQYSTMAYWECVVSVVVGIVVYHEPMSLGSAIGGVLIIAGGILPALRLLKRSE